MTALIWIAMVAVWALALAVLILVLWDKRSRRQGKSLGLRRYANWLMVALLVLIALLVAVAIRNVVMMQ